VIPELKPHAAHGTEVVDVDEMLVDVDVVSLRTVETVEIVELIEVVSEGV
jgi:hypothetical protein